MSMKMDNGDLSSTDQEHIDVFCPHFDRVLNNKKDIDFTVLELIEQRDVMPSLTTHSPETNSNKQSINSRLGRRLVSTMCHQRRLRRWTKS